MVIWEYKTNHAAAIMTLSICIYIHVSIYISATWHNVGVCLNMFVHPQRKVSYTMSLCTMQRAWPQGSQVASPCETVWCGQRRNITSKRAGISAASCVGIASGLSSLCFGGLGFIMEMASVSWLVGFELRCCSKIFPKPPKIDWAG